MPRHKLQQVLFASILRIMKKKFKLNKRDLINLKTFGTARKILNKGWKKTPQNGKKKFATEFKNGIHLQNMQTAAQYQENNQFN